MNGWDDLMRKLGLESGAAPPANPANPTPAPTPAPQAAPTGIPGFGTQLAWSLPAIAGAFLSARGTPMGAGLGAAGQAVSEIGEGRALAGAQQQQARSGFNQMFNLEKGSLAPEEQSQVEQLGQSNPVLGLGVLKQRTAEQEALEKYKAQKEVAQAYRGPMMFWDQKANRPVPVDNNTQSIQAALQANPNLLPMSVANKLMGENKPFDLPAQTKQNLWSMFGVKSAEDLRKLPDAQGARMVQLAGQAAIQQKIGAQVSASVAAAEEKMTARYTKYPAALGFPGQTWVDPHSHELINMGQLYKDPVSGRMKRLGRMSAQELEANNFVPLKGLPVAAYTLGAGTLPVINRFMHNLKGVLPNNPTLTTMVGEKAWRAYMLLHPELGSRIDLDQLGLSESLARLQTGGAMRSQKLWDANKQAIDAWNHKDMPAMVKALDEAHNIIIDRMDAITGGERSDLMGEDTGPSMIPTPSEPSTGLDLEGP